MMRTLLGHLAQFGSFLRQGEVLCTQGLCYLLQEHAEVRSALAHWVPASTSATIASDLTWHAEVVQPDGGRPDLQANGVDGKPVVKVEAKLSAVFGAGQLESYVRHLLQVSGRGVLLVLVPRRRAREAQAVVAAAFRISGTGPVIVTVVAWEDVLQAIESCEGERVRAEVAQFSGMYRVLNGDDIQPLASPGEIVAWHEHEITFIRLADRVSRLLTGDRTPLPMKVEALEQASPNGLPAKGYRRRYIHGPLTGIESYYSIGVRDPFGGYSTPMWLRFHRVTGLLEDIRARLEYSPLKNSLIYSGGHIWIPLQVPVGVSGQAMLEAVLAQVREIVGIAYRPVTASVPIP